MVANTQVLSRNGERGRLARIFWRFAKRIQGPRGTRARATETVAIPPLQEPRLTVAERNTGFAQIVGGHLDVDFVADTDADEVFAHFTGNVRQHFMPIRQSHAKHRAGQNLCYRAR